MSSSQICIASRADLPLGASLPVSAMPKPMVSGLAWAMAGAGEAGAVPAAASLPKVRRLMSIDCPPRLHLLGRS